MTSEELLKLAGDIEGEYSGSTKLRKALTYLLRVAAADRLEHEMGSMVVPALEDEGDCAALGLIGVPAE